MILFFTGLNLTLAALLYFAYKRHQKQENATNSEFKEIVEMSTEPLFIHKKGTVIYVNRSGAKMMGLSSPEQLINKKISAFVEVADYKEIERDVASNSLTLREVSVLKSDGTRLVVETTSSTIQFNGQPARKVSVRDITVEKQKKETLETIAFHDSLTGLLNRRGFVEKVTKKIEEAKGTESRFGVMFIDLDGFKEINDSLGHQVGDLVLQRVGDYLQRCIGEDDIVARLGGDEFVVLLPDACRESCATLAGRIIKPNTKNVDIFGKGAYVTPSIGIAISPENGEDIETLINHADMAMYEAKKAGKNQFRFADNCPNQKAS